MAEGRLYIVAGKKTAAVADELESRVDAGGTSVAGDPTERWTVREWLRGAAALGPEDFVVFVGEADAWESETAGGETRFERFGMRCVVKGRRALLTADGAAVDGRKTRREFLAWLREAYPELPAGAVDALERERKTALFESLRAAINPIGVTMEQQIIPPAGSADLTETERLQYRALAVEFALRILPAWLAEFGR